MDNSNQDNAFVRGRANLRSTPEVRSKSAGRLGDIKTSNWVPPRFFKELGMKPKYQESEELPKPETAKPSTSKPIAYRNITEEAAVFLRRKKAEREAAARATPEVSQTLTKPAPQALCIPVVKSDSSSISQPNKMEVVLPKAALSEVQENKALPAPPSTIALPETPVALPDARRVFCDLPKVPTEISIVPGPYAAGYIFPLDDKKNFTASEPETKTSDDCVIIGEVKRNVQKAVPALEAPPSRLALPERPGAPIVEPIPRSLLTSELPKVPTDLSVKPGPWSSRSIAEVQYEADDEASASTFFAPSSPAKIEEMATNRDDLTLESDTMEMFKPLKVRIPVDIEDTVEPKEKQEQPKYAPISYTLKNPPAARDLFQRNIVPKTVETTTVDSKDPFKISVQLAHGSPTMTINGFSNIEELYKKIADSFRLKPEDIIFCTVNTFKNDMERLFCGQLDISDLLFVHVRGQPIEISLTKTEESLGLSISDNGSCRTFIKRIKPGTICARAMPALAAGQQIAKINGECVLGRRHFEVAKMLRNLPVNTSFTLRLISPMVSGFSMLAPRGGSSGAKRVDDGLKTLRFKSDGAMVLEKEATDPAILKKLDVVLDEYLGVQDEQLAHSLLDVILPCTSLQQLGDVIRESDLSKFEFPEELVFDMWGIVGDWKRRQTVDN